MQKCNICEVVVQRRGRGKGAVLEQFLCTAGIKPKVKIGVNDQEKRNHWDGKWAK